MSVGWRIAVIALLQTLALAAMVGMKQYTLSTGKPILLETQPIDPRSLFSGDYVRLNYRISELTLATLDGDKSFDRADTVYVVLRQDGQYWKPLAVRHDFPPAAADQVVVKGRVEYVNRNRWRASDERKEPTTSIAVKYGIENYFVPEGEGRELERQNAGEKISIRVVVDKYGNPAIKAVLVNDAERYVETLL